MVSVHTAAVTFLFCAESGQCLANVYFGVPNQSTISLETDLGGVSGTTNVVANADAPFVFSDIHALVQAVGLYLLLIGVTVLILLELKELKLLKKRPFKSVRG